jgi:hypothetical protein
MWDVFLLYVIPWGGGIPAGVVLAQSKGIAWPMMMALYFLSDCFLACVFEPLMLFFLYQTKRSQFFAKWLEAMKKSPVTNAAMKYGVNPGPFSLILISFGVDPMTGRVAGHVAGFRFIAGWTFAIIGDMFFFSVIMASTLWLNNKLGDGTLTAVIILAGMILIPMLFRKVREWFSRRRHR